MPRTRKPVDHSPIPCTHCGEVFKPKRKNRTRCYNDECLRERNRIKVNKYRHRFEQRTGHAYSYSQRSEGHHERLLITNTQDQRSPLRKAYEDSDATAFFSELLNLCDLDTDCWVWTKATAGNYPVAGFGSGGGFTHRLSLEMSIGKPLGVLAAHHACANTRCVNPMHLEPATAAENTLEMIARHSYLNRIAELEKAVSDMNPNHEVLNLVSTEGY